MLIRDERIRLLKIQCALAMLLVTLTACQHASLTQPHSHPAGSGASAPAFTEVTFAAGITNRHHQPILDHQLDNIMSWVSSVGAAAAAADYNQNVAGDDSINTLQDSLTWSRGHHSLK